MQVGYMALYNYRVLCVMVLAVSVNILVTRKSLSFGKMMNLSTYAIKIQEILILIILLLPMTKTRSRNLKIKLQTMSIPGQPKLFAPMKSIGP